MDIYSELGLIYSEALTEVISKVTGVRLKLISSDDDGGFEEITGVMSLNGRKSGMLFVTASVADVRMLCSYFVGIPLSEVTENDIDDTICEFANMTAGNAKMSLNGTDYMFNLAQPFTVKGADMSIISKDRTHVISRTLSDENVTVKIKVVY